MQSDLAGFVGGIPERFVPAEMRGELVEAEHLARYRWAASLVEGKVVLDAGCGIGYGARILADSGAERVLGLDIAEAVLEAARVDAPDNVEFQHGDVCNMPLADATVDAVVCFETIEHVDRPGDAFDEFRRVLRPGGLLAVSSPNRNVYVAGNPHHRHEFVPDELESELAKRFKHVELFAQHGWITSAILEREAFSSLSDEPIDLDTRKVVASDPGEELYVIALASDDELPVPRQTAVMTGLVEVRRWVEQFDRQLDELAARDDELRRLRALFAERATLQQRLFEAEATIAAAAEWRSEDPAVHGTAAEALHTRMLDLETAADEHWRNAERATQAMRELQSTRSLRLIQRFWRLKAGLRGRQPG